MGNGIFWGWMLWLHLALVMFPGIVLAVKLEWEDLRKAHPPVPRIHREVSDYQKVA